MSTPGGESAGPRRFARLVFTASSPGWVCSVPNGLDLETGAFYLVATADGRRVGRMSAFELPVLRTWNGPMPSIVRRASDEEIARAAVLAVRQGETLDACRRLAREMNLPLRPVSAFAPLDREVVIVTYAAEERVDFRELLRELTPRTHCRVELRQIGVRDQAKAAGGWGPCGRLLCCTTFMSRFNSVTIRMAKAQRLSLNPARISGMCGRLMCCLAHEAPAKGELLAKGDGAASSDAPVTGGAVAGTPAGGEMPPGRDAARQGDGPAGSDGQGRRDGSGRGARSGRSDRPGAGPRVGRGDGAGRHDNSGPGGGGGADSGRGRPDGADSGGGAGRTGNGGAGRTGNGGAGRTGNGDAPTGGSFGARSGQRDRSGSKIRSGQGGSPQGDGRSAQSGEVGAGGGPVSDGRTAPDKGRTPAD